MSMDFSVLERVGIPWNCTVSEANDKRIKEYNRQTEEAFEYATKRYASSWTDRIPTSVKDVNEFILEQRQRYLSGFQTAEGNTQLAVSIPIEEPLRSLLSEARDELTAALCSSNGSSGSDDISESPVYVPKVAHIPPKDLHITICIPSLWRQPDPDKAAHKAYNQAVGDALLEATRNHEQFVLEVDRLMLGWDGSLLALFRAVGPQGVNEPQITEMLSDRASDLDDPMTSLRADVLFEFLSKKLSHVQRKQEYDHHFEGNVETLLRQATIVKTVGGSAHGYIHCSLSRLALSPTLTRCPVDLEQLQKLCRSWTAKLTGRRMLVHSFKLTEMTGLGEGGNKNPFDKALWERDFKLKTTSTLQKFSFASCGDCFSWLQEMLVSFKKFP